jgi:SAM-dependent methyltransferase
MLLYSELAQWWPILSPLEDYSDAARRFWSVIQSRATRPVRTILELGSGGGHLSHHLARVSGASMTLTDLSPEMLALSRRLNPSCEHIVGDMRALRLGRTFDLVLLHDAVMHMTSASDLRAAITTAYLHCTPAPGGGGDGGGGLAAFFPDWTKETFQPGASLSGGPAASHESADRGQDKQARLVEWTWDNDPSDTEYLSHMTYILREPGAAVRVEHETLRLGLFAREDWIAMLQAAGFAPRHERLADEGMGADAFLATRAAL